MIRKGDIVTLLADDDRGVRKGAQGQVLVVRKLPSDPCLQALVKWRGRSGPVAHDVSVLEWA